MPPGLPVAHEHTILELMGQPRRAIFPGKAFRFEKGPVSLHIIRMDDRFAPEPHQLAEIHGKAQPGERLCIPLPIMLFRPEKKYSYLSAGMSTNKIHS